MQVVVKQPNVMCSLSMEDTLKPRVDLLQHTIGLAEDVLPKVIARCATHPLQDMFSCSHGCPVKHEEPSQSQGLRLHSARKGTIPVRRIVRLDWACRSPSILACADESLLERVSLLRNGGLSQIDIVKMLTVHPQVRQTCALHHICLQDHHVVLVLCIRSFREESGTQVGSAGRQSQR